MLDSRLLSLLREPGTGLPLAAGPTPDRLVAEGTGRAYRVEGGAIDMMAPAAASEASGPSVDSPPDASSPELREYHDRIFADGERREALYDNLFELPKLTQAAHFRRMEILEGIALPDLGSATVVDFGSGPWGFAAVFPRLRAAAIQVTCDVSFEALRQAQAKEASGGPSRALRLFITSDGDAIGLADGSVDVVWAGEVIEHVRYPRLFLQEIARILKPDGVLVLSTPNRDAPLYAARGLQNTVGPEHIALLNARELHEEVSSFFDVVDMSGFELSLWHEIDDALRDEALLRALQERALRFPDLSSGIVLSAKVRKDRFRSARRRYSRTEIAWPQCDIAAGSVRPVPLFGGVSGGFLESGASLSFPARCSRLILLFWSHTWSGFARIAVDGAEREVDLYSHAGGFRRVEWDLDGARSSRVSVSRPGRKRDAAASDETIFYKAIGYLAAPGP